MKKAVLICILATLMSACANSAHTEKTEAPEISVVTTVTTSQTTTAAEQPSVSTTLAEEKEIITSTVSETKDSSSVTKSESRTSATEDISQTVSSSESTRGTEKENSSTTRKAVTSQTIVSSMVNTEQTTRSGSSTTSKPKVTAASNASKKDDKPKQSVSVKPKVSTTTTTTTAKPKETTTASKSKDEQYAEEYWEIIDRKGLHGKDGTCLETMVLNLKYSDTPPSYYEKIGRNLKHDGTDYGKAVAVYKWMRQNGWGSCVYYSMETYFVCKGIGLECAYAFATKNDWYGHTYSVVKVNGTWYVLDTQGRSFLENSEYCTRMFDGNDKDMTPFEEDIWYDYDEKGEYRDWSISD